MTVTFASLTSGTATSKPITTASISPTNTPVFVAIASACTPGTAPDTHTVSGCGLTWTTVGTTLYASRRRLTIIKGTGSPSSGTLTITEPSANSMVGAAYAVFEFSNVDSLGTAGTNTGSGSTTSDTIAGSPSSGDISLAVVGFEANSNPTWEANYTERYDISESGNTRRLAVATADPYDGTPSCSWASSANWGMVSLYIFDSGGGGGLSIPVAMRYYRNMRT